VTSDARVRALKMVEQQLRDRGIQDRRVLEAMTDLPRHRFVPSLPVAEAYADKAQPTCEGQTISQPYMVALMSQLLDVRPDHHVLEIGTGSGYQTAILARLANSVVTVERSSALGAFARKMLADLSLDAHIEFVVGDGTLGWPQHAPYDRIIVTAAAPEVPEALKEQTADDGRIVIPVGGRTDQQLLACDLHNGQWEVTRSVTCRFVPLVGQQGWPSDD